MVKCSIIPTTSHEEEKASEEKKRWEDIFYKQAAKKVAVTFLNSGNRFVDYDHRKTSISILF